MIKTSSAVVALLIAAAFPAASYAAGRDPGVNQRQYNQQHRIQQGWRSGDLTRREVRNLQGQAQNIRREERAFRSDGHLSRGERATLHQDLNHLSRNIERQRNDGDRRLEHGRFNDWRSSDRRFDNARFNDWRDDRRSDHWRDDRRFDNGRFDHWRHDDRRYGRWDGDRHNGFGRFGGDAIDRMQARQRWQIQRGIRSGELTHNEAARLFEQQRDIRREERAYRADGILTRGERRDLWEDLNQARRDIYNETHDAQERH